MDETGDFDFDLDRSTEQAWAQFADRLAEVISVIDDHGELTIGTLSSRAEPAPYVRFTQVDRTEPASLDDAAIVDHQPGILAEASGNASLGQTFQLSVSQLDALADLGWNAPSLAGVHPGQDFWVLHPQGESAELAQLAVDTLRDVFGVEHPVFLAPDQLAEILQPDSQPVQEAPDLAELVAAELTAMFGHPPIRDAEGDFAIRVGSTMVFVRATADGQELLLFSAIVHDVEGRSRAVEVLNDLNVQSRYGRFALHQDRVFVTMSLMAEPFVPTHLHKAVRIMSQLADGIDDELARKLRGRTTFEAE